MAGIEDIRGIVGGSVSSILNVTVIAFVAILLLGTLAGLLYYFLVYRKKYNIDVKIISQRANDPNVILDKAAILFDRKNNTKYFRLLNTKKEMEAPPFKILQATNKGDYLELYRKSEDEFAFLTRPKIDKEWIIRSDGKKVPIASMKHRQMEADYYWLYKRQQEDRSWIAPDTMMSKIIQMMPILIPSALMLILFLFFLNALPEVLSQLRAVISELGTLQGVATPQG